MKTSVGQLSPHIYQNEEDEQATFMKLRTNEYAGGVHLNMPLQYLLACWLDWGHTYLCKRKLADTGKDMGGMERNCRFVEGLWERFFKSWDICIQNNSFKELTVFDPP